MTKNFSSSFNTKASWLPDGTKVFVLPSGFPGSVSDDYLEYMLLQLPTNITGWICSILVTSSLRKAVGVGSFSGTSAAATAAAIRWVSKDGLGTLGRFFIGGRFGDLFDDDPKQWRMYADFIGSAGRCYPTDEGLIILEEVWEVTTQLIGMGLGVLVLDSPGIQTSYTTLTLTWLSMRLLHLLLRYQSLSVLVFNTINLKRARMLVKSHVFHSVVPGYLECNKKENFLSWQKFLKPSIIFGVSLEEIIDGERSVSKVKALLQLYKREQYILVVNQQLQTEFQVFISFKVNATGLSVLRSIWQTYWLYEHWQGRESKNVFDQLQESMSKLMQGLMIFLSSLRKLDGMSSR